MIKHLPIQKSSGYTILEIIISVFILIIVFSIAQASYKQFILRKSLDAAVGGVISDVKLAQAYALYNRKTETCSSLNGYVFFLNTQNNATNYTISADCGGTFEEVKTVQFESYAKGITADINVNPPRIYFNILGGGNNIPEGVERTVTLSQQTSGNARVVIVTSGGEVK